MTPTPHPCGHRAILAGTDRLLDRHRDDAPIAGAVLADVIHLRDDLVREHLIASSTEPRFTRQVKEALGVVSDVIVHSTNHSRFGDDTFVQLVDDMRRRIAELDGDTCPPHERWPRRI